MRLQAMASYAAAVDIFRAAAGAGAADGVAAEDMAAMQALIEEDENSINAFATGEDESLDYDVSGQREDHVGEAILFSAFRKNLIGDSQKMALTAVTLALHASYGRHVSSVPNVTDGT